MADEAKLTDRQRRLADAVLAGTSLLDAARAAGYSVRNPRAAEIEAGRTLRKPYVATYLSERRAAAAKRSEINLAEVLRSLHAIGVDTTMPPPARVAALTELAKRLATDDGSLPVVGMFDWSPTGEHEQDAATASAAVLEAVMAGKISPQSGRAITMVAEKVVEVTGFARVIREAVAARTVPEAVPKPWRSEAPLPHPRRPVWREAPGGAGAGGQYSPSAPEQHEHQEQE